MLSIIQLLGGLVTLILGGELLVRGATEIALRMKISPLVVGLTVVAFGTSSPELFISLYSAVSGSPDLAIGNVVGSNICNLGLVLGMTAMIYPIEVHKDSMRIDWPVTMLSSLTLFVFAVLFGGINQFTGLVMVAALIIYLVFILRKANNDKKALLAAEEEFSLDESDPTSLVAWVKDIAFIAFGIGALSFGSDWFVGGAKEIFINIGVDERVIGIVVLALGTSLPELVTSVMAAIKRNTDLAVGNLLGSNIFNVLSILGFTSMVTNINISQAITFTDMPVMLGITFLVMVLMLKGKLLSRLDGFILLAAYLVYTYTLFPQ
ncbi:calcium/sodium antiporter [Limibacter armeniacum]|uniref:calcium/sodium antiporter n=1 Tax=Limibacter armeniacum TaxID=466084 RepID=UPI002FE5BA91